MQSLDQGNWDEARKRLAEIRREHREARDAARTLLNDGLREQVFDLVREAGTIRPDELKEQLGNLLDADEEVIHQIVRDVQRSVAVESRTVLALDDERIEQLHDGSFMAKHAETWEKLDFLPEP